MRKGKFVKRGFAAKTLVLVLALVTLIGATIGGTLAWLMDDSDQVVNTFTDSDINISLTETTGETYKMIPGHDIPKDPKVTLNAGSEPCYLFVKVTENLGSWSDNKINGENPVFTDYLHYTVATTWTELTGEGVPAGVYYIKVDDATTVNTDYPIIVDNKVTVDGIVTKGMMDEIDGVDVAAGTTETKPTLTFKAYAVQLWKATKPAEGATAEEIAAAQFTAAEAWAQAATLG